MPFGAPSPLESDTKELHGTLKATVKAFLDYVALCESHEVTFATIVDECG
jgi:hypothetical protein